MSNSLIHYEQFDEEGYLFISDSGQVEFLIVQDDMRQLNNFCVMFLKATSTEIREAEQSVENAKGGVFRDIDGNEMFFTDHEARIGPEEDLSAWLDTGDFLAKANCLLLLACFTEKSLVSLCKDLGDKVPRPKPGQSKNLACIDFLKELCENGFAEPESSIAVREDCRRLRNYFAHGEWAECRTIIGEIDLADAFAAVSLLLRTIESAYQEGR